MAAPKFRVLVADPPWQLGDSLPGEGRGAAKHYGTLSMFELQRFPIPEVKLDGLLFLWRLSSMQEEALRLARAWRFVPVAELVWLKKTKTGKRHFGMGRYVRQEHETCLIAYRGHARDYIKDLSVRSTFEAPVPLGPDGKALHSAKPPEFYEIVEKLIDGPYAELFARRRRKGWTCSGDELK